MRDKESGGGGVYLNASQGWQHGPLKGMSRCMKAANDCGCVARVEIMPCAMRGREVDEKRSVIQKLEPRKDGICNAITTVSKDSLYIARLGMDEMKNGDINPPEKNDDSEKTIEDYLYNDFGIFALTPRESLRLMGVNDEDIDKMKAVNSKTQLLKQAGNSIVVTCLEAIFSQLNIQGVVPWNEKYKDQ